MSGHFEADATQAWSPSTRPGDECAPHSTSSTSTATPSFCLREPTMMPSTGETSEKSRPTARMMWSFSTRRSLVGSKPIQPMLGAAPHRNPGVGGVGALQARLARRRDGAQIAADIGRRQPEPAQARNHHMGKILADAVALLEHLLERRRDHGGLRVVFEIVADAVHQVDGAGKNAAARRKTRRGIGGDRRLHRHQRARKDVADRRSRAETGGLKGHVADALPGRAWRGAAERAGAIPKPASWNRSAGCDARFRSGCSRCGFRKNPAAPCVPPAAAGSRPYARSVAARRRFAAPAAASIAQNSPGSRKL